jgi:hypothetical protein
MESWKDRQAKARYVILVLLLLVCDSSITVLNIILLLTFCIPLCISLQNAYQIAGPKRLVYVLAWCYCYIFTKIKKGFSNMHLL